jgi:hypothetical protein
MTWFFLTAGSAFVILAKRCGRELADLMDGPRTAEERATDARWNSLVWRLIGVALIVYAGWLLLGL